MASSSVTMGDELEVIQTELIGFKALAGDAQVQLTESWPELPSNTASLLSIAPRKCLVAGAGPDSITIVKTDTVRKAFDAPREGDSEVRPVEPLVAIPVSERLSQIAFTSDERYLLVSSENGSTVTAYEVDGLIKGDHSSTFDISTSGPLMVMCPNVAVEKGELCAIVTNNGDLHMINTKSKSISDVLVSNVNSISWSTKGKQLVAGRTDGTIHQLTPEGEIKAEIPCPEGLENVRVSSLQWLENHLFIAIYMTSEDTPTSTYFVITRKPPSSYTFSKIGDPVDPFGAENTPHHSILRLKDFPPNLQDVLVVSSTVSPDIGLLTRSKTPLSTDVDAGKISGIFTLTEMSDDTRRATVPMKASFDNSVPIGISMDLSARDTVYKPIASEEIDESPGPVPAVWLLNDDGVLVAWWLIYNESIKEGTTFPGMASMLPDLETLLPSQDATPAPAAAPTPAPALVAPSAFGAPSTSSTPAFGSTTAFGAKASPWGSAASSNSGSATTSSAPAFGQPSTMGAGQSLIGAKTSPWGANSSSGSGAPAFGQSGFGSFASKSPFGGASTSTTSPFGGASTSTTSPFGSAAKGGGFSSFGSGGGFGSLGNDKGSSGGSIFGQPSNAASPFGSASTTSTAFKPSGNTTSAFGNGQPFKLQSSFTPDDDDGDSDAKPVGGSMFSGGFGAALDSDKTAKESSELAATESPKKTLFGSTPETKSVFGAASVTFGSNQTPSKTLFGQPASTSKEDETNAPKPGSIFGKSSGFGAASQPGGSSMFGAPSQPGGKSMFGAPSTGQTSLFSTPKTESKPASIFGAPAPTTSASRESIFGAPSTNKPAANAAPNPFSSLKAPSDPSSEEDFDEDEDENESGVDEDEGEVDEDDEEDDGEDEEEEEEQEEDNEDEEESEPESPSPAPKKPSKTLFDSPSTPAKKKGSSTTLFSSLSPTLRKSTAQPKKTLFDSSENSKLPKLKSGKTVAKNIFASGKTSTAKSVDSSKFGFMSSASVPAPPESTSKSTYAIGDTSSSGASKMGVSDDDTTFTKSISAKSKTGADNSAAKGDAVSKKSSKKSAQKLDSDDEGSGEEVNGPEDDDDDLGAESDSSAVHVSKEISPSSSGRTQSSIGGLNGSFTMVQKPTDTKNIFGNNGFSQTVRPQATVFGASFPAPAPQPVVKPLGSSILAGKDEKAEQNGFLSQQRKTKAEQEAQEAQPLVDEEYDEVQKLLESEPQPTLKIDQLIAHTDVAPPAQDNIPAQVEAVYRDINSMVDTVGLNARSVLQFVMGHKQAASQQPCTKDDLESTEEWVLPELGDLADIVEVELMNDLRAASVPNPEEKKAECAELARNMSRLRSKQKDLEVILARLDPNKAESSQNLPLSPEQLAQQNELRRGFAKFTQQLAAVEEALVLLKTRISSAGQALGKGAAQTPTVDAVMRTIAKMTSMAEKRSGDVDVLETQVRKLRLSATPSRDVTPSLSASVSSYLALPASSSSAALFRSSARSSAPATQGRDLAASLSGLSLAAAGGVPARKKLGAYSAEDQRLAVAKRAQKKAVLAKLRARVEEKGVAVWELQQGC